MTGDFLAKRERAIKSALENLFSTGSLDSKICLSRDLCDMPGLGFFMAELPWQITFQNEKITGLSENLGTAAKDIHAHLAVLAKNLPPSALVKIEIDEARLPKSRASLPPIAMKQG